MSRPDSQADPSNISSRYQNRVSKLITLSPGFSIGYEFDMGVEGGPAGTAEKPYPY